MTELFDSYVSDIGKSFQIVKTSLSGYSQQPLSKKQATLPSLKVQMYEIQKLVKLMETQLVSLSGRQKNSSSQKVKGFKMQYETVRKKVMVLQQQTRNQRNKAKDSSTPNTTSHSLQLNERPSSGSNKSRSKYSRLQQTRYEQEDVNVKLKQSVKVMYEIGDMSDNISHELSTQTSKIQNSTSKLGQIRGQLMKGEKKIKRMMVRLRKNQFIFYMVILLLIIMAAFIVSKVFA